MSDLDRVSEGRFLVLEDDKRVLAGEEGGKTGGLGGGVAETGLPTGEKGGLSGFKGATAGFRGEGADVTRGWKRCRCEAV